MDRLYNDVSLKISRLVTLEYNTSFSNAIRFLGKEERNAIYSIYGFVRIADEIVDTFHGIDKQHYLESYEKEFYLAYQSGVSTNPVLHSFQLTVKKYNINDALIRAFLKSMMYDTQKSTYCTNEEIKEYIYGSADVVGLMCLKVYINGDETLYNSLKAPAMRLGSAFQKVNFIRDLKNDTEQLKRQYFPEVVNGKFTEELKNRIVEDIEDDFHESYKGVKLLPGRSKLAVALAYHFYRTLLKKIQNTPASVIMETRIRITGIRKFLLFIKVFLYYKLNLL